MRKTIEYLNDLKRSCPICKGNKFELLSDFDEVRMGQNFNHHLRQSVAACKECGFIFANPTISQSAMNQYYQDQITYFNAEDTYSIEKRMNLIDKYADEGISIIEFGGNSQGKFRDRIEKSYKYQSYDLNLSASNDVKNMDDLTLANMIVSYYVFEHIVTLGTHIEVLQQHLSSNGIMIIEVPDASKYYRLPSSLSLTEHINHFTPESLTKLMLRYGFELIEISRREASRDFGFVGVYINRGFHNVSKDNIAYEISKSIIKEGIGEINEIRTNFSHTIDTLYKMSPGGVLWCASNLLEKLLREYKRRYGTEKFIIIDEDPRKQDFGLEYNIMTSKEAFENGVLYDVRNFVILSYERKDSIIDRINSFNLDKINIYVVDDKLKLVRC